MENFLKETTEAILSFGMTPNRITFLGSKCGTYGCTWEEFQKIADVEYDDGFGGQKIASDLVILFDDGTWLERSEDRGSEWWSRQRQPRVPLHYRSMRRVVREDRIWTTVEGMHP